MAPTRPTLLALAILLPALAASCSAPAPEPQFQQAEEDQILTLKAYDACRTAGQLKGTALLVFELPEEGRYIGKPEVKINGHAPDRVTLAKRQASVYYYPVSEDGRLETRPVSVIFKWRGAGKDKVERTGTVSLVLRYGPDLGFAINDCEMTEEKAPPKEPTADGQPKK